MREERESMHPLTNNEDYDDCNDNAKNNHHLLYHHKRDCIMHQHNELFNTVHDENN